MVIFRSQNKITDFLMILAWASPFNLMNKKGSILHIVYTSITTSQITLMRYVVLLLRLVVIRIRSVSSPQNSIRIVLFQGSLVSKMPTGDFQYNSYIPNLC